MQRMRQEVVQRIPCSLKLTKYLMEMRMFLCLEEIDLKANLLVEMS